MTLFEELSKRGLIAQMTHPEKIRELIDGKRGMTFYIGFDPTADSLHVGHFLALVVMAHLQKAGHRPIALLGTGTTMIGDPSGRTDMRQMLSIEEIESNAERFKKQMSRFIDFSDEKALMLKNGQWLLPLNYISLLRDVGVHFSVNKMLSYECFKSRMERGLSFIEFNYMIMQSYDFLHLFKEYGCVMQLGGDDQWSNIIGGIELIRRTEAKEAYGLTLTLLATKEGKKMGKTQAGALWLDPDKTSPYEFFQYWRNVADDDVINCLKMITFIPLEEIEEMDTLKGSALNKAKERLAYELTLLVHGKDKADKAMAAAGALFASAKDGGGEYMPTTVIMECDLADGSVPVISLLVRSGLASSKSEARRLIEQGGVTVADKKVEDANAALTKDEIGNGVIIKKGKKAFHKIVAG